MPRAAVRTSFVFFAVAAALPADESRRALRPEGALPQIPGPAQTRPVPGIREAVGPAVARPAAFHSAAAVPPIT